MSRYKRLIIYSIAASIAISAKAQSIDEIAVAVARDCPAVAASILSPRAEAQGSLAETALPDPSIEVEQLWGNHGAGNKLTVSASQSFDWPGIYAARRQTARRQLDALPLLHRAAFLDVALQAKLILLEIVYTRQCREIYHTLATSADSLYLLSERSLRGGEISILDHHKLAIEQALANQQVAETDRKLLDLEGQLAVLAGNAEHTQAARTVSSMPHMQLRPEADYTAQVASYPSLMYNDALTLAAHNKISAVKRESLPGFSLGYVYNLEAGTTFTGFNASVSIPLWSRSHRRAAAQSELQSLETKSEIDAAEILTSLHSDYAQALSLQSRIDTLRPLICDNDVQHTLFQAYKGGQISLIDLLNEKNYYTQAHLTLLQMEFDYAVLLAKLNRLELIQ